MVAGAGWAGTACLPDLRCAAGRSGALLPPALEYLLRRLCSRARARGLLLGAGASANLSRFSGRVRRRALRHSDRPPYRRCMIMAVYTDNPAYGGTLLPAGATGAFAPAAAPAEPQRMLLDTVFEPGAQLHTAPLRIPGWQHILAVDFSDGSQYDRLIDLARRAPIPDRVACLARTGRGFHGFRGRDWNASAGNIHLTVHLAPQRAMPHFETVFTALAAVAVMDAIDAVPELAGRARVKWVNDVLVDGAKVAGVLAYTQTRSDVITSVILGIGLNVEATPEVERSDHVPTAGSLRGLAPHSAHANAATVLGALLHALQRRYSDVLAVGHLSIMEQYRTRSAVIGHHVTICEEGEEPARIIAAGRVEALGDGLELYLEGRAEPVTRGRLILGDVPGREGHDRT
jgi:BirA family transcriptional regulator, biotin operon repressor / biotin---[acetyl-CoA-carboxylase] ligase